jgi:hypothetical protein
MKMCIDKDINCTNKKQILQLFDFYEEELYTNTDENRRLMEDILNIEKPFYENLTADQRKQYEEITDLRALNSVATDRKIFIFAFKLAINLIL